jgi:hypothetical protein
MIIDKIFEEQFWIYNTLTNNLLDDAVKSLKINNMTEDEVKQKIIFLVHELFKELK